MTSVREECNDASQADEDERGAKVAVEGSAVREECDDVSQGDEVIGENRWREGWRERGVVTSFRGIHGGRTEPIRRHSGHLLWNL
jgi:hypothetical protein